MVKVNVHGLQAGVKKLSSQLLVALMIVGLVAFVGVFIWQSFRIKDMQGQLKTRQTELAAIEDRNSRLKEHLEFYNSPGYMLYVEKVAREGLGLARPGETVILTVPDKNVAGPVNSQTVQTNTPNALATVAATAPAVKKPAWQNWFGFFFGSKE